MMAGPLPYDFEPRFTEEELRERENEAIVDSDSEEEGLRPGLGLGPVHPNVQPTIGNTNWCQCNECIVMAKEMECRCCHEVNNFAVFVSEANCCISNNEDFPNVCLNRAVLRTTLVMRNDIRGHSRRVPFDLDMKSYRFSAYRMFTYWVHGRLGRGVRRVIPSCVVEKIRTEFPDPNGRYIGFLQTEEACPPLTFGLECSFQCHCANGDQCDAATGACPKGCAATFSGTNCQQMATEG